MQKTAQTGQTFRNCKQKAMSRGGGDMSSALAYAGAAAAAAAAYVIFGPPGSKRKKKITGQPGGLVNLGNTCFVNSLVQALVAVKAFKTWVDGKRHSSPVFRALGVAMDAVNGVVNKDADSMASAGPLLEALRIHGWHIGREQQDAHELLQVLFSTLEEELRRPGNRDVRSPISDVLLSHSEQEAEEEDDQAPAPLPRSSSGVFPRCARSPLTPSDVHGQTRMVVDRSSNPFSGTFTSRVCFADGRAKSPVASSVFNTVTLNLPPEGLYGSTLSLERLLLAYVTSEAVGEERQPLQRQLMFGRMPRCLCFHIERNSFRAGMRYKRMDFVAFPETLDMKDFVYVNQVVNRKKSGAVPTTENPRKDFSLLYTLRSVVVHVGPMIEAGHYVTYRKGATGTVGAGDWFVISDSNVDLQKLEDVLCCRAYMLFYERLLPL